MNSVSRLCQDQGWSVLDSDSTFMRNLLTSVSILSTVVLLSACQSRADVDWVSATGVVKDIKGISAENTTATRRKQPLFVTVSFKYRFKSKDYEGSQTVSINVPKHFEVGQAIALKVNSSDPRRVNIDLPPGPPDRTGLTWRQMPEYTRETSCP